MKQKQSVPKVIETAFDLLYLAVVPALGVYLILTASESVQVLWGIMAFVLVFGDAFHLVPRVLAVQKNEKERYQKAMGIGKQITSITMTVFYLLLWHIGLLVFGTSIPAFTIAVWVLSVIRICLCLFPQNAWTSDGPSLRWGVYRNIPFLVQGLMVSVLYGIYGHQFQGLHLMWLAILLSFAFYIPVVLCSHKCPKAGMLMLPKTCVYVWMICMGIVMSR